MEREYRDLPDYRQAAIRAGFQAQAEKYLEQRDYARADQAAVTAQRSGAPTIWVDNFRGRFQKFQDIDQRMKDAELAQQNGDFAKAVEILGT